ncbi:hypothetical protein D3C81_1200170 [compost metagenome]
MTCSCSRRTSASRVTSQATNSAWPPASLINATVPSPPTGSRSATTTLRPSRANARAVARPIPAAPPVTSATWPEKVILIECSNHGCSKARFLMWEPRLPAIERAALAPACKSFSTPETRGRSTAHRPQARLPPMVAAAFGFCAQSLVSLPTHWAASSSQRLGYHAYQ